MFFGINMREYYRLLHEFEGDIKLISIKGNAWGKGNNFSQPFPTSFPTKNHKSHSHKSMV